MDWNIFNVGKTCSVTFLLLAFATLALLLVACARNMEESPNPTSEPVSQPTPKLTPTQVPALTPLAQPAETEVLFNPEEYDIQCMDRALGMDISDQIIHMGRPPTGVELVQIEQCLVGAAAETPAQAETKPASGDDTKFDPDNYSPECMVEALG